jgi:hypothetical protein
MAEGQTALVLLYDEEATADEQIRPGLWETDKS